jgi:DUF1365 family protein
VEIMPSDTSPEAAAIQADIFRRMTPGERVKVALDMSDSMRNIALAGLRGRHPEMTEEQLKWELVRLMYGFVPKP